MVNIRLETIIKTPRAHSEAPSPHIGWAKVILEERMTLWMKCLISKKGHKFLAFPSANIENQWVPVISWSSSDMEKKINEELREEIKKYFG